MPKNKYSYSLLPKIGFEFIPFCPFELVNVFIVFIGSSTTKLSHLPFKLASQFFLQDYARLSPPPD
jgi:hypothetical protein